METRRSAPFSLIVRANDAGAVVVALAGDFDMSGVEEFSLLYRRLIDFSNGAVLIVRRAEAGDRRFLEQMLAIAAYWRAPTPRPVDEVLACPDLAHYVEGWPARGDFGVVAEDGAPVGAAWWRRFAASDPGYGFIDELTPEISIGVVPQARGVGTGTLLLKALISAAQEHRLPALSLSVEIDNGARRLYQRVGFEQVNVVGGSLTMVLGL